MGTVHRNIQEIVKHQEVRNRGEPLLPLGLQRREEEIILLEKLALWGEAARGSVVRETQVVSGKQQAVRKGKYRSLSLLPASHWLTPTQRHRASQPGRCSPCDQPVRAQDRAVGGGADHTEQEGHAHSSA